VARDRQRAKQRRARRNENPGPAPRHLHQEDVPGPLEHASGEVDEFEAALVSGAEGETVTEHPEDLPDEAATEHPEDLSDESFEELEDEVDAAAEGEGEGEGEGDADRGAGAVAAGRAPARRRAAGPGEPAAGRGGNRLIGFLRASWAELQRVQWPDRRQVGQATAVVLGFVVIAGAYLGLADRIAQQIVDFII